MLRASGIPSRYRHGTLDKAHAQQLILSMFPTPTRTVGYVPPGTPTSDPANDATLLLETQDHWWVEAYLLGQGWQDLDPSFSGAVVGQRYVADANVATDGTDRIAEVPDAQRSKVTMKVKVETYYPASFTETGLFTSYPLEHTFNAEELVGEPVTLQHLVHKVEIPGLVINVDLHYWTYTPYLVVAGKVIQGTPYDELRSFFPFASHIPTAEWLDFEVHDPDGHTYTDERTIVDTVGYAPRHVGGDVNGPAPAEGTFLNAESSYSTLFAPSAVPASAIGADYQQLIHAITSAHQADAQLQTLSNSGQSNDQLPAFRQAQQTIQDAARLSQQSRLLMFAALSDYSTRRLDADLLTRSYAASPRILMTSWEHDTNGNTDKVLLDLRRDDLRTVVSPAQAGQAIVSFNLARGLSEMTAESTALGLGSAQEPVGVASVFTEARRQSIPLIIVTSSNLAPLASLPISADAKARIMGELQHPQNLILVPSRPVLIDGQPQTGWLIINAITGQAVDEMESGQHQSLIEYSFLLTNNLDQATTAFIGFLHGFAAYTFVFLANALTYAATEPDLKQLWQVSRQKTHDFINTDLKEKFNKFKDTSDIFLPEDAAKMVGDDVDAYLEGTDVSANFAVNFVLPANAKEAVNISNELGWTKDLPTSVTVISGAVAIKAGGLIQGADYADAVLGDAVDPSLSNQLVARAPGPPIVAPARASGLVQAAATTAGTTLRGGLTVAGLQSEGGLRGLWAADAQDTSVFTGVTPLSGTLYAMDGAALGTGEIAIQPQGAFASATVMGSPVASTVDGVGSTALYAAGLDGIGAGSAWNNYADTLGATQPYTLALQDVVATVNGTAAYTGSFTLVTSDTPSFTGSGHTAVPNFARTAGYTTTDGQLNLGPATGGDFSVGGASFDASNGVALSGYDGPITVTSVSPTSERVELDGNGSFFTLHASPANSTVAPGGPATFQARIDANSDDTYTTTVEAPPNWTVALDASGLVTATPPLGTAPGDYAVRVSAQSGGRPDLVASAVHTVTVTPAQGVVLAVDPDQQFTVPWGPGDPNAAPGDTNDGRLQLTGAAFTIDVTNTSTVSHTFDLSESGLPDGWTLLSNTAGGTSASLALPAGGVGQVGLYISPTVTMLPAPGTVEPFTVHVAATDDSNSALTGSASQSFTIPAIAFSQITATPNAIVSSPGLTTTFQIELRNVGNVQGVFPLSVTLPISDWTAPVTSPLTLDPGQAVTQTVTVQTPDGTLGQDYPVEIDSPSDGYTQSTSVLVHLTSPAARAVDNAAQTAGALFPDNLPLSAGLAYLGQTIETFQTSCQHAITMTLPGAAACSTDLRDHIVSAAQQVAAAVATTSPLLTDGDAISDTARTIGATTTVSLVDDAIVTLQGQITALQDQLTDVAQHGWQIGFTPGRRVVLQGKPATFGLRLANTGSLTTTYALTLTTPSPSVALDPATTTVAVAPGASVTLPVTATTSTLGSAELQAEVAAVDAPDLASLRAPAGLTTVDALLRVTGVRAAPSFVEYGPGATSPQVVAQVANVANEPISGTARVRLLDASGTDVYSSTQPLQLSDALSPVDYPLNPITATSLTTGTYVLAVDILDADGQIIPHASGRGVLSVGQAVTAGSAVYPSVVAPGDVTATTSLTSALDLRAITPHIAARALAASRISAQPPVVGATSPSGATASQRAATTDVTHGATSHTYITATGLSPLYPFANAPIARPGDIGKLQTTGIQPRPAHDIVLVSRTTTSTSSPRVLSRRGALGLRPLLPRRVQPSNAPGRSITSPRRVSPTIARNHVAARGCAQPRAHGCATSHQHRPHTKISARSSRPLLKSQRATHREMRPIGSRVLGAQGSRRSTVATRTLASAKPASRASQMPRVRAEVSPLPTAQSWLPAASRRARARVIPTPTTNVPALYIGQSSAPSLAGLPGIAWPSSALAVTQPPFVPGYHVATAAVQPSSYHPYQATHTNSTPIRSRWVPAISGAAFVSPSDVQQTNVCGTITADTHWTLADSPYNLTCYVTISPSVTLTVDPGVIVEGSGNVGLYVQGTLSAMGTSAQPITFTSASATPIPGDWTGLFFDGVAASSSQLSHVTVEDAGRDYYYDAGYDAHPHWGGWLCAEAGRLGAGAGGANGHDCYTQAVLLRTADPTFDHLTIQNSQTDALYVMADVPPLQLTNSHFVANGGYAVHLQNIASLPVQPGTLDYGTNQSGAYPNAGSAIAIDGGTLTSDMSVSATQALTYTLLGYPTIAQTATLSLAPGSVVLGQPGNTGLYVQGTLSALGTADQPIIFRSAAVTPTAGDWTGLFFDGAVSSSSQLSYVTVADAGRDYYYDAGYDAHPHWGGWLCAEAGRLGTSVGAAGANGHDYRTQAILLRGSSPSFDHLTVQNSQTDGIYALADAPPLQLSHAAFVGNGWYAIHLENIASLPQQPGTLDLGASSIAMDGGALPSDVSVSATQALSYTLLGYPTIAQTATLSLAPGSVVLGQPGNTGLYVQGTLSALGTPDEPITFESAAMTPTAGDWTGLFFDGPSSSDSRLNYVTVADAGRDYYYDAGYDAHLHWGGWLCVEAGRLGTSVGGANGHDCDNAAVLLRGSSPSFDRLTVQNSRSTGLYLNGSNTQPVLNRLTVHGATNQGIYADGNVQTLQLSNATIDANTGVAIELANPNTLTGLSHNSFSGNGVDGVQLDGGTLTTSINVSSADAGQLKLANTVIVGNSGALTLAAGTTVLGNGGLDVQGSLTAIGTSAQPISFTSGSATPGPGDWPGLTFEPGSLGYLDYAALTYAATAIAANNAAVTIHHSTLTADSMGISNCADCTNTPVHAENNYWGSPDGPAPTGHGPAVSSNVITDPFETSSDLASTAFKPTYTLATSLDQPAQTTGVGGAATYNLGVRDTGNVPNTVTISLTGLDPSWYSVSPTRFSLIPGQTGQTTLAVAPPTGDCTLVGTHPFTLTATSGGDDATHDVTGSLTLTANPAITGLAPDDNATVGATDALFSWQTSVSGTSTLRIFPTANPSNAQVYTATAGLQHQVHVSGLVRNTDYSWSVHTASACGASDSAPRTLHIGNGLVFSQRSYDVYIQRDYNQLATLQVTNQDDVSHTLLLTNTAPPPATSSRASSASAAPTAALRCSRARRATSPSASPPRTPSPPTITSSPASPRSIPARPPSTTPCPCMSTSTSLTSASRSRKWLATRPP